MKYAIFRACERFNISPPEFGHSRWDDLEPLLQADLIAYNQIRQIEEVDERIEFYKAIGTIRHG